MYLFNITVITEEVVAENWFSWISTKQLPKLMEAKCLSSNKILKVVDSPNEGVTYSLQFIIENDIALKEFQEQYQDMFIAEMYNAYPNQLVAFSTLMEFVA